MLFLSSSGESSFPIDEAALGKKQREVEGPLLTLCSSSSILKVPVHRSDKAGQMWLDYRKDMALVFENQIEDEDHKAITSMNFLQSSGMMNTTFMDQQANKCFIGVACMLFHLSRHRMMVEQVL